MSTTTAHITEHHKQESQGMISKSPHSVRTTVNYYLDDGTPPVPQYLGRPVEQKQNEREKVEVTVSDVSGHEEEFTLESHGFQYLKHTSAFKKEDFTDAERITTGFYAETAQMLKDATGATRVHIWQHVMRGTPTTQDPVGLERRNPVQFVHNDVTEKSARDHVRTKTPEYAERLLKSHFQIINVWRPLKTIYKDPLGITDSHSVPEEDLVKVKLLYPGGEGETYSVKKGVEGAHKWYFKYAMTPEEVVFIKCYDSRYDGRARRIPHCAFKDSAHEDAEDRESVECRCLVFYENDPIGA